MDQLGTFGAPRGGVFGGLTFTPPLPAQLRMQRGFDNGSITSGERLILERMSNSDSQLEQTLRQNGLSPIESAFLAARRARYEATRELFERVDLPTSSRNQNDANRMTSLDGMRTGQQRGELVAGVRGGNIDQAEFQRLNDFARGTETMRARMREGGYSESERQQIDTRLREYDRLQRLFGSTSGRAGEEPVRADSATLFDSARRPQNPLAFGGPGQALERDHQLARARGVLQRNGGTIYQDERLDVRVLHQSQETRPSSSSVDGSARASRECFSPRENLSQFQTQMSRIDSDGDGRVTRREIHAALSNPNIRGEDARMLAAAHQCFDQLTSANPVVSFGGVGGGIFGGLRTESAISLQELDPSLRDSPDYRRRLSTLNSTEAALARRGKGETGSLFGKDGRPDPRSISQGMIGDCWFLASVGGMRSEDVARMVSRRQDGSYEVRFPGQAGRPPEIVAPPTDAQRYLGVQANGDWAIVMEQAARQVAARGDWGEKRQRQGLDGGFSTEAYSLLTGRPGVEYDMATQFGNTRDLGNTLSRSLREGRMITVYNPTGLSPDTIAQPMNEGAHVWTVVGYDQRTGMVTVRNPWGQNERADRDGRDDGTFQMPLSEFQASWPTMIVSEPPARQGAAPTTRPAQPFPMPFPFPQPQPTPFFG